MVKQSAYEKVVSTFHEHGNTWALIVDDTNDFNVERFYDKEGCGGIYFHLKNKQLYKPITKKTQREENTKKPFVYFTDYGLKILCCCIDMDLEASKKIRKMVFILKDEYNK